MDTLNFLKATVVCGSMAFLVYSVPLISQIVAIGLLAYGWLFYAHRLVAAVAGKRNP